MGAFEDMMKELQERRKLDKSKLPMYDEQSIGRIERKNDEKPLIKMIGGSFDFASMYPSVQRMYFTKENGRRIQKIKKIIDKLNKSDETN